MRMRAFAISGLCVVGCLASAATASAADNSFEGTCTNIEGVAKFDKPLQAAASDNAYHFTGTGQCTGKLNGKDVSSTPIDAQVDGPFNGGCQSGKSTAPGPGFLRFKDQGGVVIRFTMTFTATLSEVDFQLKGEKSGEASGHASFLTPRTPPDVVIKCETDGNEELPFDAEAETSSPLVSPEPSASSSSSSGGGSSGGGGGGGAGSPSGGGGGGGAGAGGSATTPSIAIPAQRLAGALKKGLRVTCRASGPATCELALSVSKKTARKYKLRSTRLGTATARIAGGASETVVVIKLTAKARKAIKKAKSLAVTVSGTVGSTKVTASSKLSR